MTSGADSGNLEQADIATIKKHVDTAQDLGESSFYPCKTMGESSSYRLEVRIWAPRQES